MNDKDFKENMYLYKYIPEIAENVGMVGYFFFIPFLMFLVNKGYIEMNIAHFNRSFLLSGLVYGVMFLSFDKNSAHKYRIPDTENYSVIWIQIVNCVFMLLRGMMIPAIFYLIILRK
ncbi:hypothetical protein [Moraxella oblonga]|uniref:hypothetical protein n=1 Tax=Moraxella oblonga TaxID=200413 RepID=UPI000829D7AA|nr:hypothetical protein [Moraxella oblonga]